MILFSFKWKFFARIVLAFMFFTVIGTLLHEFGHIFTANYFGYETKLYYKSMTYTPKGYLQDPDVLALKTFMEEKKEVLEKNNQKENQQLLESYLKPIKEKFQPQPQESNWIIIGGPAQTLLTSIVGLLLLSFRNSKNRMHFKFLDWLGVFLALFALREVFNTLVALAKELFTRVEFYPGDEFRISEYFGWNVWVLPLITFLIGCAISLYVIFKVIPLRYRFTFILAGLLGGISGYIFWFHYLGPLLLPFPEY